MNTGDCSPEWLRNKGVGFGPELGGGAYVTELKRIPFLDNQNDRVLGAAPYSKQQALIDSPNTQIFQVIPNGYYDTGVITAHCLSGGTANQLFGFLGKVYSDTGKFTYSGINANYPDFVSDPFATFQSFRMDLPYGTVPFYVNLYNSTGTSFNVTIMLFNLGG